MKPIIKVENLGKRYRIGGLHPTHVTFREMIGQAVLAPCKRRTKASGIGHAHNDDTLLWALRNVSFEVMPGELVGIIGRNGAGKSTLLKILSRITKPTTGRAAIYGRIGSLLEVGTGFHPDLTGRQNVFLNGAILGMRKSEIRRKFDEIVSFSEVERFIDTPVKHYSSGMYLRLAFAVAAHLEPEVLLVDEVLAVGDMNFQRKCLDKMQDVRRQGRTVIFVSHNMPAVTRLCERVILLSEGGVSSDGPSHRVVSDYLNSGLKTTAERKWPEASQDVSQAADNTPDTTPDNTPDNTPGNAADNSPGNNIVRLRGVRVRTEDGQTAESIDIRRPVGIEMMYQVLEPGHVLVPNYHFFNEEGVYLFVLHNLDPEWRRRRREVGRYVSTAWIPGNFLAEGSLLVGAAVSSYYPMTVHFYERDAVAFQVIDSLDGDSARGDFAGTMPGVIRPVMNWTTHFEANLPNEQLH